MTLWQPRHRRSRNVPPFVRIGTVALIPVLAAAGIVVALDDDPSSPRVLHAQVGGSSTAGDLADRSGGGITGSEPSASGPPTTDAPTAGGDSGDHDSARPDDTSHPAVSKTPTPELSDPEPPADQSSPAQSGVPEPTASRPPEAVATPTPSASPSSPPTRSPKPTTSPEPTRSPWPTPNLPPIPVLTDAEQALVDATNAARARAGCPDLRVDARLTDAARGHSADMRARLFYSHTNPDGQTPADRAAEAGYDAPVGENLSLGLRSAALVVTTWSVQPEERSNLLDCNYTAIGVGAEFGLLGAWWTQLLGRG